MTILDKIVRHKLTEVAHLKEVVQVRELEALSQFQRQPVLLSKQLKSTSNLGIIAEFKRRSPSKGVINDIAQISTVAQGYQAAGASAMSVLTDEKFFGGSLDDLRSARAVADIPILRKDFIVDELQILMAKAAGADIILLISECLTGAEVKSLAKCARRLGLDVLLEMHDDSGLEKITDDVTLVGINNRDLKTFTVDIERSIALLAKLPSRVAKVAESGIGKPETVLRLSQAGFDAFLIGENFMKSADPSAACKSFIDLCKSQNRVP